jgi:hypothetical protein
MRLFSGRASYRGYGDGGSESKSVMLQTGSSFCAFCLGVLDKDDSGLIQFSSQEYSAECVEQGLNQLRATGFTATIENVPPCRRANPTFDKRIRIKRETSRE